MNNVVEKPRPAHHAGEVLDVAAGLDHHRGRKVPVDRQHGALADAVEQQLLAALFEHHQLIGIFLAGEISEQGRNTQGVRLMNMQAGEKVVSFEYMAESNAARESEDPAGAVPNGSAAPAATTEGQGSGSNGSNGSDGGGGGLPH